MLLAIAFLMFALLLATWLVIPEQKQAPVAKPVEKRVKETGAIPVHV